MIQNVQGFDWDAGNITKCQKHGVTISEIESVFAGIVHVFPDMKHSITETRYLAMGRTMKGRSVFLAFTLRSHPQGPLIRPISARFMHDKEVQAYETQITQTEE